MKKTSSEPTTSSGELRSEYRFDYRKAQPNRYADPERRQRRAVVLDEDVAETFTTAAAVNRALAPVSYGQDTSLGLITPQPKSVSKSDRIVTFFASARIT